MKYKNRFEILMFEFVRLLSEKGYMKDEIVIKDILNAIDEFLQDPRNRNIAHEFLCKECKEI